MEEYIDIVNSNGEATGKVALKSEAHKMGWYHNTAHLWLYTKDGCILLQQRSHKKAIHPLLWDVSVAGHIDAGETFTAAATREANEEIGIVLQEKDLKHIGTSLYKGEYFEGSIKDYEFHQIFIAECQTPINNLRIDIEEVESIKLVDFKTFEALLNDSASNGHFIATNKDYYLFVLDRIKQELL